MKILTVFIIFILFFLLNPTLGHAQSTSPTISNIQVMSTSVRVYEKYEVKFDISTNSQNPFLAYDLTPPPGVTPGIGITVDATLTNTNTGKKWTQPAFYMIETVKSGTGASMFFEETNKKYWVVRFSPQEIGTYQVSLKATDASGTTTVSAGNFTATSPIKKGFIQVSKNDPRYFEYSNGDLYFPIGPVNPKNNNYVPYKDSGPNLERPWLGGIGIYSTNWARWKSSAENLGNEGIMTRLSWREKAPGHDLSYEIFYPTGFRMWLTNWLDDMFGPKLYAGKQYQVKLVIKTVNIAGPRNSAYPYGFVIRAADNNIVWGGPTNDQFDNGLRNDPKVINHINSNQSWQTITGTFTAPVSTSNIHLYLDNVTAGQVYVDEFSMKDSLTGAEIIRNPRADQHMFVEQRPAAFMDWQLEQGEANNVFFKYVVHDKNDWIQNHLLSNGQWADAGNGYYQDENTKARWLLRQWYRYLVARWGYSTAIHSWELNNEGPPNDDPPNSGSAPHWRTAQAFAKFMHDNDAHPHLASTSFWCCWRPTFWGNNTLFPDIDYADLHMYTDGTDGMLSATPYDMAAWTYNSSIAMYNSGYPSGQKGVGKPLIRAETGIAGSFFSELTCGNPSVPNNPGIWYHNLLWGQLNIGAMFDTGYWWSEHFNCITNTTSQISKPFYLFTQNLDLNKGGYQNLQSTVINVNNKLRAIGQKNINTNKAHVWIQNIDHTWKNMMNGITSSQTGTVTFTMNPNTIYKIDWWNTYTGVISRSENLTSNSTGTLTLQVTNLTDDTAVNIMPLNQPPNTPAPTNTPPAPTIPKINGNANGDSKVNLQDYNILVTEFLQTGTNLFADFNNSGKVDYGDYNILVTYYAP